MAEKSNEMEDLRKQLQQVIWDNEKILEDRVFALATGSLGVSLTIFQLQDNWSTLTLWLIAFSWAILIISIFIIMYSLYRARSKAERATEMTFTANEENYHLLYEEMTNGNNLTKQLNKWSYILTGLGILLTAIAAFITLIIS